MASLFKSTFNARWLPTGNHRYLRTSCPRNLSDKEIAFLKENNILTVVDLREPIEYEARPCPLENDKDFKYYHLTVSGGDVYPITYEETMAAYLHMVDKQMDIIVNTILTAKTGVIYFCAAGKDRTGVVSALILNKLGYDEEYILDDYMASKPDLMAYLETLKKKEPDKPIRSIIPNEDYIKSVLKLAREREWRRKILVVKPDKLNYIPSYELAVVDSFEAAKNAIERYEEQGLRFDDLDLPYDNITAFWSFICWMKNTNRNYKFYIHGKIDRKEFLTLLKALSEEGFTLNT